jgi:hypothetical protein
MCVGLMQGSSSCIEVGDKIYFFIFFLASSTQHQRRGSNVGQYNQKPSVFTAHI